MMRVSGMLGPCALLSLSLYTSCSDSDGPATTTLHFRMTSYDGCVQTGAFVDLASAHAVVARNDTGGPDCTIAPVLAGRGCSLILNESDSGDTLSALLTGCQVGSQTSLFSCVFTAVDLMEMNEVIDGACDCKARVDACYLHGICDVCASESADGEGCEDCFEGGDEDGDGKFDCDDEECEVLEDCGRGRTTISCTETSTTSSTLLVAIDAAEYEPETNAPMSLLFGARD